MKVVVNTTSASEGVKTTLFLLFSEEALRVSSLKGITTVAGGSSTTLDKEKLNLIYCKSVISLLPQNIKKATFRLPVFLVVMAGFTIFIFNLNLFLTITLHCINTEVS